MCVCLRCLKLKHSQLFDRLITDKLVLLQDLCYTTSVSTLSGPGRGDQHHQLTIIALGISCRSFFGSWDCVPLDRRVCSGPVAAFVSDIWLVPIAAERLTLFQINVFPNVCVWASAYKLS